MRSKLRDFISRSNRDKDLSDRTAILILEEQIPHIVETAGDIPHDGAGKGIKSRREKGTEAADQSMAIDGLRTCSRMAFEMKQRAKEPNNSSFVKERLSKGERGELEDLKEAGRSRSEKCANSRQPPQQ
jgi:hypothetical protein